MKDRIALAAACSLLIAGCDVAPNNVTPAQLEQAKAVCDPHGGVEFYNTPQPLDVYCTDKFHARVYTHE